MPVFNSHQMRHLPLTPPEYYDDFAHFGKVKQAHYGYQQYDEMAHNPFLMGSSHYYLPTHAEQQARYNAEMKRQARAHYQAQIQRDHIYGPIAAPTLPPLRAPAGHPMSDNGPYHGSVPAPAPKEEKSAGGVAAHLDYDMDTMVDFVAEMATSMFNLYVSRTCYLPDYQLVRLVQPTRKAVQDKFRVYVSSVLTSTRLPKATILLALHYLAGRMTLLSSQNRVHHRLSDAIFHMLTVSLMLSSKFLDDNTFQNRSWSEVSGMKVAELNTREVDWLNGMNYRLHVDWEEAHGVRAWFERWNEYEVRKKTELSLEGLKLSPIDTNVHSYRGSSRYSPPATFSPPDADLRRSLSPTSARQTAANTPEFYPNVRNAVSYMDLRHAQPYHGSVHQQHQVPMQQAAAESQMSTPHLANDLQGDLIYTRQSPVYGPGYVLETRSNGMCTWEVHNFVGIPYTQAYAAQLQLGWCEGHRRLDCTTCLTRPPLAMTVPSQAVAA